MAFSVAGTIRVRVLTNVTTGVDTTVDVTLPYEESSIDDDPGNVKVTTNAVAGTREVPTRHNIEWTITFPWTSDAIAAAQLMLSAGTVISFEVCRNPTAATANRIYEVVRYTTVGKRSAPNKVDDVTRLTIVGAGGDYYPEQVGRTNLPSPFSAD